MDKLNQICFPQNTFNIYLFLLFLTLFFVVYYIICLIKKYENNTNNDLIQVLIQKQEQEKQQVQQVQQVQSQGITPINLEKIFLNKIYNPLSGTSPLNPQGSFNNPYGYDGYRQFQMLGYLSGPNGRFPVMGRYKYSGRSDRFEYYTIDDSRNRIKINFKTKNDNELYSGDPVVIPELGGNLIFNKYEDQDNRYDPNII